MTSFIAALLRALAQPDGPVGELLSARRKSHLLQAEWYARLAAEGEKERQQEPSVDTREPAATPKTLRPTR